MTLLGNIVWFIFGGFELSLGWFISGLVWCVTIVGIPVGIQCFKMVSLVIWPFNKEVYYSEYRVSSFLLNILWFFITGMWLAIGHIISGILLCITIIGIPFAFQHFKYAKLACMPFGANVVNKINL